MRKTKNTISNPHLRKLAQIAVPLVAASNPAAGIALETALLTTGGSLSTPHRQYGAGISGSGSCPVCGHKEKKLLPKSYKNMITHQ